MILKKSKIKRIIYILSFIILIIFINDKYVYAENKEINKIIEDIGKLEILTDTYRMNHDIDATTNQLVLYFLRNNRYDIYWNEYSLDVHIDNLESYLDYCKDYNYLKNLENINTLSGTINFDLLFSSLDLLQYTNNCYINWGYIITNSILNQDKNIKVQDLNAIIDSNNLNDLLYKNNLSEILQSYYETDINTRYNNINNFINKNKINFNSDENNIYYDFINNSIINIQLYDFSDDFKKEYFDNFLSLLQKELSKNYQTETIDINILNIPEKLVVGEKYNLEVESEIAYTLQSNNPNIIEINKNTLITKGVGECIIILKGHYRKNDFMGNPLDITNITKQYEIKVLNKITLIDLEEYEVELDIGEEKNIIYNFHTDNEKIESNEIVEFESTDDNIAIVSKSGKITALDNGVCYIKCKLKSNPSIQTQCKVIINKGIETIEIDESVSKLYVNDELQLKIKINGTICNDYSKIYFKSSNENITIDENGFIKANKPGECYIYCYENKINSNEITSIESTNLSSKEKNDKVYDVIKFSIYKNISTISFNPMSQVIYYNNNTKNKTYQIKFYINAIIDDSKSNFNNDIFYDKSDIEFKIYKDNNLISEEYIIYNNHYLSLLNDNLTGIYELRAIKKHSQEILGKINITIHNNIQIETPSNTDKQELKPFISPKLKNKIFTISFITIYSCSFIIIICIFIICFNYFKSKKIKSLNNNIKNEHVNEYYYDSEDDDLQFYTLEELEEKLKEDNKHDYL